MRLCSIVVPVHNHAALTRQCVTNLLDHPAEGSAQEIVVVDDRSTDETPEVLRAFGDRIRVVTHAGNQGFAISVNDGAAAARGELVVFLNNDTVPTPGWLDRLVEYADRHPKAAAIGARLLFPDGSVQHAGVVIGQDRHPWHVYMGFPGEHPAVLKSRRFQVVTAACMLVRRAAFEEAWGFDPTFHNGYEDVDLCLRLGLLGHEVHYCADSVVYHLESATRDSAGAEAHRNYWIYRRRWGDVVRPDDFEFYVADGLVEIRYPYPLEVKFDPRLAARLEEGGGLRAERLLAERARQVDDLLRSAVRLEVRAVAAEMRAGGSRQAAPELGPPLAPAPAAPVDVVIPVYNGLDVLPAAVESVLAFTDLERHTLTLIDDASPDPRVAEWLWALRARAPRGVRILLNERNLGFPSTANRGLRLAAGDVVLLNSDARVTAGWIEKLQAAAYSQPRIASVSPLSNNATIFSVPRMNEDNPIPPGFTIDSFAALVERVSARRRVEVPTTHGFCLYLKRGALDAVGALDDRRFGAGYGEENDWCMRAAKRGYVHVADDATFVFHKGQESFTTERRDRTQAANLELLEKLHPEYFDAIGRFFAENPLRPVQEAIARAVHDSLASPPRGEAGGKTAE